MRQNLLNYPSGRSCCCGPNLRRTACPGTPNIPNRLSPFPRAPSLRRFGICSEFVRKVLGIVRNCSEFVRNLAVGNMESAPISDTSWNIERGKRPSSDALERGKDRRMAKVNKGENEVGNVNKTVIFLFVFAEFWPFFFTLVLLCPTHATTSTTTDCACCTCTMKAHVRYRLGPLTVRLS